MINNNKDLLNQDISEINELAKSPDFWKSKSESYYIAAKILDFTRKRPIPDEMEIEPSYLIKKESSSPADMLSVVHYLMGTSLELLLKAQCIKKGTNYSKLKSHNLTELANNAEITLDDNENKIFQFLSEALYNYGRYPNIAAPDKVEIGLYDQSKTERNPFFEVKSYNSIDFTAYKSTYEKIKNIYNSTSYENWKNS